MKVHVKTYHDSDDEAPLCLLRRIPADEGVQLEALPFVAGSRAELEKTLKTAYKVYGSRENTRKYYDEWQQFASEHHPQSDDAAAYLSWRPQSIPLYEHLFSIESTIHEEGRSRSGTMLDLSARERMILARGNDLFDDSCGGGMLEAVSMPSTVFRGHNGDQSIPHRLLQPHSMIDDRRIMPLHRRQRSQARFLRGVSQRQQRGAGNGNENGDDHEGGGLFVL